MIMVQEEGVCGCRLQGHLMFSLQRSFRVVMPVSGFRERYLMSNGQVSCQPPQGAS